MSQCKIRAIVELTDVETSEWDGKVGSDINPMTIMKIKSDFLSALFGDGDHLVEVRIIDSVKEE